MTKYPGDYTRSRPIYDQHDKHFARVSAFVVARDGERVATIAFAFPRDGAGRLYAYVHWIGEPMVRGWASGYGYDKKSAAASVAAKLLDRQRREGETTQQFLDREGWWPEFRDALTPDDGYTWDRRLAGAGFTVWQAV